MQDLKEKNKNILQQLTETRKKKVEEFVLQILKTMLENDLPLFDIFYIQKRSKELLEKTLELVNYGDLEILKAKNLFLRTAIKQAQKKIPVEKKFTGEDETAKRDRRCESISREIVKMTINEPMIMDEWFVEKMIEENSQLELMALVSGYLDTMTSMLEFSLSESFIKASEKLFGVPKEKVRLQAINNILKS